MMLNNSNHANHTEAMLVLTFQQFSFSFKSEQWNIYNNHGSIIFCGLQKNNEFDTQESDAPQSNKCFKEIKSRSACRTHTPSLLFLLCEWMLCCAIQNLSCIKTKIFWGAITALAQRKNVSLFEQRQSHGGGQMNKAGKKIAVFNKRQAVSISGNIDNK